MLAMLKRFVLLFWNQYLKGKPRTKKEVEGVPISLVHLSLQQRDLNVRIIHAGGIVELYHDAISAFQVMEKYPGMCLARPEIFKRPHESLLQPDEKLLPGKKFYLIPCTTVHKLKRKHPEKLQEPSEAKGSEERLLRKEMVDGEGLDSFEDSFCYAKDFFICREKWSRFALRKRGSGLKKPFTPPIKKPRMWTQLEWQPSLTSVKELSP